MKNTYGEEIFEEHIPEDCPDCDGTGFIVLIDYDGPGLNDEDNCYCECHKEWMVGRVV